MIDYKTTPTGTISLLDVIEELDGSRTARKISLGDSDVRGLAGVSSGKISMDNLRGKSGRTPKTLNGTISCGGASGYPEYGFNFFDSYGSVSPTKVEGMSFRAMNTIEDADELQLSIAGNLPQDFVRSFRPSGRTGSLTLTGSVASYSNTGSTTTWTWSIGPSRFWYTGDSASWRLDYLF